MIEIWTKNNLVSDNNCNIVNLNPAKKSQGVTNNVGLPFNVGDTTTRFMISIEQDNQNWWHLI